MIRNANLSVNDLLQKFIEKLQVASDSELEKIFIRCVNRNYINDTDEALSRMTAGGNQLGT